MTELEELNQHILRCEQLIQEKNYSMGLLNINIGLNLFPNNKRLLELKDLVDSLMGKKEISPRAEKIRYMQTIQGLIGDKELSKAVIVADFISKKYPEDEELKKIAKSLWKEYHGDNEDD